MKNHASTFFVRGTLLVALVLLALVRPLIAQEPSFGSEAAARDLVEVRSLDPSFRLDVRYATSHNFMGRVLYKDGGRVFLAKPAAQALLRVQSKLREQKLGLVLLDGYRPWSVTKAMWDQTPGEKRQYVADPAQGSRHNRGCAIDVTLQDLTTGRYLDMPSAYDDFSDKAHADSPCADARKAANRALLRKAMDQEGFQIYPYEWWHYDFRGWEKFPLFNYTFPQLDALHVGEPALK